MSTFLETTDGFVNAEHIVEIVLCKGAFTAVLTNGKERELAAGDRRKITRRLGSLVPAHSDFELLIAWFHPDNTVYFERAPIVGWRSDGFGGVEPITPRGGALDADITGIRFPDGQVEGLYEAQFANEDDWKKYVLKQVKLRQWYQNEASITAL